MTLSPDELVVITITPALCPRPVYKIKLDVVANCQI